LNERTAHLSAKNQQKNITFSNHTDQKSTQSLRPGRTNGATILRMYQTFNRTYCPNLKVGEPTPQTCSVSGRIVADVHRIRLDRPLVRLHGKTIGAWAALCKADQWFRFALVLVFPSA
jgi:hypothetical protein